MCETTESISAFLEINGQSIWYEIFGTGSQPVLMIPGSIGTGRTDFYLQLCGEYALDLEKFTFITVEAPGWGRSRPPARKYDSNVYNNDAEIFQQLMNRLGYEKYSAIGWSNGAKVALLMATKYPESIQSLVLIAIFTDISPNSVKFFKYTQSVKTWSKELTDGYYRSYQSIDEIQDLWQRFVKYIEYYRQYFPEDIYKNKYHLVRCPVLIFHGDRDQMIEVDQPLGVCERLKQAKLHRFPLGAHDTHIKYPAVFKRLTEEHLGGVN